MTNKVLQKLYELRNEIAAVTESNDGIVSIKLSRKAFHFIEYELNKSLPDEARTRFERLTRIYGIEIEMDHTK